MISFRAKLNDDRRLRKLLKDWCVCVTVNHLRGMPYGIPQNDDFWKSAGYIGGNNWYILTPSGQVLSHDIEEGIAKWLKLPAAERKPGAVKVGEPPKYKIKGETPAPPEGGLVIRVFMRQLDRDSRGQLAPFRYPPQCPLGPREILKALEEPSVDAMWLTKQEAMSLVPTNPNAGDTFPVPDAVRWRIIRAHLADGTGSLIFPWEKKDVHRGEMTLTVEKADSTSIRLRLEGRAALSTQSAELTTRSAYEPRLLGYLEYDRQKAGFSRFDIVAIGSCSSATRDLQSVHPILGIVFELNSGQLPSDLVQPRCHWVNPGQYYQMEK